MSDHTFLNTYHNASTAPPPNVPGELASFMLAADPVLAQAAELARVIAAARFTRCRGAVDRARLGQRRKYCSLSEKYAAWADYDAPARGLWDPYVSPCRRGTGLSD